VTQKGTAKHFTWFDPRWRTEAFTCPRCGWRGTYKEMGGESYWDLVDYCCPNTPAGSTTLCDAMLLIIAGPTLEEVRTAAEAGNAEAQEELKFRELAIRAGRARARTLNS
jgi:hypothetical protein